MAIKIQGTTVIDDSRNATNLGNITASGDVNFAGSGSFKVPSGTTAQRPASPAVGEIRYNTDNSELEQYDGTEWGAIGGGGGELGTLTKTFVDKETATITLGGSVDTAPSVSVIKEVPQTGVTTNKWSVATDGYNYDVQDLAKDTSLSFGTVPHVVSQASLVTSSNFSGTQYQRSVDFKNDGTKVFTLAAGTIREHNLSTPWSLSSSTKVNEFDPEVFTGIFSLVITFKEDGTKLFVFSGDDKIHQFSLSTAWDLSTISYDNITANPVSLTSSTSPEDIQFKNDGTKLYLLSKDPYERIFQFSLSPAWDITSLSYDNVETDISAMSESSPRGFHIPPTGDRMYVVGNSTTSVAQFNFGTLWDASTLSYSSDFNHGGEVDSSRDLFIGDSGNKAYISAGANSQLVEYDLSSSYEINSASFSNDVLDESGPLENSGSMFIKPDGTELFVLDRGDYDGNGYPVDIKQLSFGTAYDVSSLQESAASFAFPGSEEYISTSSVFTFSDDGTKLFVRNYDVVTEIAQFSLSSAWDISSINTPSTRIDFSTDVQSVGSIAFLNNGSTLIVESYQDDALVEFNLSAAYDLTTASPTGKTFATGDFATGLGDIVDNDKKIYLQQSGQISQLDFKVPGDISTLIFYKGNSTGDSIINGSSFVFVNDSGTKMITNNDEIIEEYDIQGDGFVLGFGDFDISDLGSHVLVNGGKAAIQTSTGGYEVIEDFDNTNTAAGGEWEQRATEITNEGVTLATRMIPYVFEDITEEDSLNLNTTFLIDTQFDQVISNDGGSFAFNSDGTKLYVLEPNNSGQAEGNYKADLHQFDLSEPYKVSTASLVSTVDINEIAGSGFEKFGEYIHVTDNDQRLFIAFESQSISDGGIHEFDFGRPGDITSLSAGSDLDAAQEIPNYSSSGNYEYVTLFFKPDGSRFFLHVSNEFSGQNNNRVYQVTLGEGYEWQFNNDFYYDSVQEINVVSSSYPSKGIYFSNDGTTAFVPHEYDRVEVIRLANPWDLTSATNDKSYSLPGINTPDRFPFSPTADGNYVAVGDNSTISLIDVAEYRYPNNIVSPVITNAGAQIDTEYWTDINSMNIDVEYYDGNVFSAFSTDGRQTWSVINLDGVERNIVRNNSGTWEINTNSTYNAETFVAAGENNESSAISESLDTDIATYQSFNVSVTQELNEFNYGSAFGQQTIESLFFRSNGTRFYASDYNTIYQCDLATAWDISTASYNNDSFSPPTGDPDDIVIDPSDSILFIFDISARKIYQYSFGTSGNVDTLSYDNIDFDLTNQVNSPEAFAVRPDGTKLYVYDSVSGGSFIIYQYSMSTSWDLSSISYDGISFESSDNDLNPKGGIQFTSDGRTMLIGVSNDGDFIYQYELSIPWDVSTAVFTGNKFDADKKFSSSNTRFESLFIKPDDTRLFVLDDNREEVREFTVLSDDSRNKMGIYVLNGLKDSDHITLGDSLDLAIMPFMRTANRYAPEVGESIDINYDANVLNQGAVLGTDYEFDKPANDTVRIKALSNENFKVRVV